MNACELTLTKLTPGQEQVLQTRNMKDVSKSSERSKGVFGLTFGFGFCSPKSQKPTKGVDPESSFF
jgi:hypothetical protein